MAKYIPKEVNKYQGSQVIINSDRLVFNAKEDAILLYSDKAIGFSTGGSIYFDTSQVDKDQEAEDPDNLDHGKFIVNSPYIYLGLKTKNTYTMNPPIAQSSLEFPTESAVLGDQLRKYLNDVLGVIEELLDDLYDNYSVTVHGATSGPNKDNEVWMNQLKEEIQRLKDDINLDEQGQLLSSDGCVFLSKNVKLI